VQSRRSQLAAWRSGFTVWSRRTPTARPVARRPGGRPAGKRASASRDGPSDDGDPEPGEARPPSGVGKGTLAAWLIAKATRGQFEGDRHGRPVRVLIVGDEDAFEPIWVPRLYAAGVDLDMLRTLDDGEHLDDLQKRSQDLGAAVRRDGIGFVLLDQLLDHVSGGAEGQGVYNPKHVRQALMPLRRVSGEQGIAATGLLHPIKGNVTSFRQLMAGSHQ